MRLAERSLATGIAAQNRAMTLKTHRALAELLMKEPGVQAKALEHVEGCLDLAATLRQPQDEAECAWVKASILHDSAPAEARAAELRALDATERSHSPRAQAVQRAPATASELDNASPSAGNPGFACRT